MISGESHSEEAELPLAPDVQEPVFRGEPAELPLPPRYLAARVGTVQGTDPLDFYLKEGARLRGVIEELVPQGWEWTSRRVLDFGCGAGRVLRHFADEGREATYWGCDVDKESIRWDAANLSPPFHFFENDPSPPLPLQTGSLDLIWAMSVFTHITDRWSAWLAEMHRLLTPDGILIASFLGDGMWEPLVGEPYFEQGLGMTVLHHWKGAEAWVFHSEWWLREHWGRAFDVMAIKRAPRAPDGKPQITHSYIALRRRDVDVDPQDLEHAEPGDPRELAGLQTSLRLARRELADLATQARAEGRARARLKRPALALRRLASRLRSRLQASPP